MAGPAERDGQRGPHLARSDHTDVKPGGMPVTRRARFRRKLHLGGCITLGDWTLVIIGS
jgi:hypothetical protein